MLELDLRNLTDAMVAEARPNIGQCTYAAPCIIGALIPEDQRAKFDNMGDELGNNVGPGPMIDSLVEYGFVSFVDDRQADLAKQLQNAFDNRDLEEFDQTVLAIRKALA